VAEEFGPQWNGDIIDSGRIICYRTAHGYLGIGHPADVAIVSDLLQALSLFGDEAVVAWDRDVAGGDLLADHDLRDIGGVIWPGSTRNVGKLWFANCRPVFHLHRGPMRWCPGHGC
jgi:hypothetical protein